MVGKNMTNSSAALPELLTEIGQVIGPERVTQDHNDLETYGQDWTRVFKPFSQQEEAVAHFRDFLLNYFFDVDSAFAFFQQWGREAPVTPDVSKEAFKEATRNLVSTRTYSDADLDRLFARVSQGSVFHSFNLKNFQTFFKDCAFRG